MPRRKGWKCSDDVRKNMSEGALQRPSKLCYLYGFTPEFVVEQKAKGLIWCSRCKSFAEGKRYRCNACTKIINIESYAREHPADRKERRRKIRESHLERSRAMDRKQSLRKKKISHEDYVAMFEAQGGVCAICGRPPHKNKRLSVDHNHVCCTKGSCPRCRRALLCDNCNLHLCWLESDFTIKAQAYLARYPLI